MDKQFHLTRPCANCPFRNDDQAIELRPGRKRDIIRSLLREEAPTFHCHKTVYRKDGRNHDEEGNYRPTDVAHCPGAIAVLQKLGEETTASRLAMRFNLIGADHYLPAHELTLSGHDLGFADDI